MTSPEGSTARRRPHTIASRLAGNTPRNQRSPPQPWPSTWWPRSAAAMREHQDFLQCSRFDAERLGGRILLTVLAVARATGAANFLGGRRDDRRVGSRQRLVEGLHLRNRVLRDR